MVNSDDSALILATKIRSLPPEKRIEVEDFVDFLLSRTQERDLVQTTTRLSDPAFAAAWDNEEDAVYDEL